MQTQIGYFRSFYTLFFNIKFILLFLFYFTFSYNINSQTIDGRVLDSNTNLPLENVNVYLEKFQSGTLTDVNGTFVIELKEKPNDFDFLQFSLLGYSTLRISISELREENYNIFLKKHNEELDEVTLNLQLRTQMSLKYKSLPPMKLGVFAFNSQIKDNKLYIISGDASRYEDEFNEAIERASFKREFDLEDIMNYYYGDFSRENHSNLLQIYDLENNIWLAEKEIRPRTNHGAIIHNNNLIVFGGKRFSKKKKFQYLEESVEIINLETEEIFYDLNNPHTAVNAASFVYNDNLIIIGGSIKTHKNGDKDYSSKSHFCNLNTGEWFELPSMVERKEVQGVLVGDKIYLVGGNNGEPLRNIEVFDLIKGKWHLEGQLPYGISRPSITSTNDAIYIYSHGTFMIYNIHSKILESYEIELFLKQAQLEIYNDKLYIIGGYREDESSIIPSHEIYSIKLNQFKLTKIKESLTLN